ncbi:superoxide dismutase family protein [Sphingomonas oryzagri]
MIARMVSILGLALIGATPVAAQTTVTRTAPIVTQSGVPVGSVTLTDAPGGVLVHLEVIGLTKGWHAVHFHEKADCSDPAFKSAGGHVHTMAMQPSVHGLLNPDATDDGDLPNIYAGIDGRADAELFSSRVALRAGSPRANLLDADGSALVIHASPDDYQSQPIGGAGARVACAAIR